MILIIYFYILKIFLYINIKNNFLKIKNIILIYFQVKNTLKNNYIYAHKHTLQDIYQISMTSG
jgi:hypothetical protein